MEAAKTADRPRPEGCLGTLQTTGLRRVQGIVLGLFIASYPTPGLWSSDFFLPRFGPAPLHFASAPAKPQDYVWPVPLNTGRALTNQSDSGTSAASTLGTNSAGPLNPLLPQTNSPNNLAVSENQPANSSSSIGTVPAVFEATPVSAGNLLLVTPQMLADYFKANLDGTYRQRTNGFGGPDVLFEPPSPKMPPSSEAIYRTQ